MRGSGAKGLPGRRKPRAEIPPPKANTDLATYGQAAFRYHSASMTQGSALIIQNAEVEADQYTYILDAGSPVQAGMFGIEYQLEDAEVSWSHDGVRFYKVQGTPQYNNPMFYDPTPTFGMACNLQMPLMRARYWRFVMDSPDPPGTERRFAIYVYNPRDPDIQVDVNEHNRDEIAPAFGTSHFHHGLTLDMGGLPDILWVGSANFDADVCDVFYATDWSSMRRACLIKGDEEKFEVIKTTRTSVSFSENLWGHSWLSGQRGPFHPNITYWSGTAFTSLDYYALGFKHMPSQGIGIGQSRPLSDRTYHGLGSIPDFAFVSHSGADSQMGGVYGMSKDDPSNLIDYGIITGSVKTRADHGFSIDENWVYHPKSTQPTYILAMNTNASAGRRFGTYTGNGSATGPIVGSIGFDPTLLVVAKLTSGSTITNGGGYKCWKEGTSDLDRTFLQIGSYPGDFFSLGTNQFQAITANASVNESGEDYWYGCFDIGANN